METGGKVAVLPSDCSLNWDDGQGVGPCVLEGELQA